MLKIKLNKIAAVVDVITMSRVRVRPLSATQLSATQPRVTSVNNDECAICLSDEGTISSQNFTCGCLVKTHTACADRWFSNPINGCIYCRKPTSLRKDAPKPPTELEILTDDMLAFYSMYSPSIVPRPPPRPTVVPQTPLITLRTVPTARVTPSLPAININIHVDSRHNNIPPPPRRSGYSIRDMIFIGCLSVAMLVGVIVVVIMII